MFDELWNFAPPANEPLVLWIFEPKDLGAEGNRGNMPLLLCTFGPRKKCSRIRTSIVHTIESVYSSIWGHLAFHLPADEAASILALEKLS